MQRRAGIRFLIDFDSTITKSDTCTLIPTINNYKLNNLKVSMDKKYFEIKERFNKWNDLSNQFMLKYNEIINKYLNSSNQLINNSIVINNSKNKREYLNEFLKEMDSVELFGVNSLAELQICKGITRNELQSLPSINETIQLAPNALQFFKELENFNHISNFCVMSSNWSFDLIDSFLKKHVFPHLQKKYYTVKCDYVNDSEDLKNFNDKDEVMVCIYCNNLYFDEMNCSNGEFEIKQCITSNDKLLAVNDYVKRFAFQKDGMNENYNYKTIYIGDSVNDLRCLLLLDNGNNIFNWNHEGILYCPNYFTKESTIKKICKHFQIELKEIIPKNLNNNSINSITYNQDNLSLYIATDWKEITSLLK
ncbi:hypothetical protein ABK040_010151 [Willaertia magna]